MVCILNMNRKPCVKNQMMMSFLAYSTLIDWVRHIVCACIQGRSMVTLFTFYNVTVQCLQNINQKYGQF